MKTLKNLFIIIVVFLAGCATTMNVRVVDLAGRALPSPHYVLQNPSTQLTASFYYELLKTERDVDGTLVSTPIFLPMDKTYKASPNDILLLVIEISNPKRVKYHLWSETMITHWKKSNGVTNDRTFAGGSLGKSNIEYRQFAIKMPASNTIKDVLFGVRLYINSNETLMYFGDFYYRFEKKEVIRNNLK